VEAMFKMNWIFKYWKSTHNLSNCESMLETLVSGTGLSIALSTLQITACTNRLAVISGWNANNHTRLKVAISQLSSDLHWILALGQIVSKLSKCLSATQS